MLVEFVSSGSSVAVSNFYSAGNVSEEFPKEGLLGVVVGMWLSRSPRVGGRNDLPCYFLVGVMC